MQSGTWWGPGVLCLIATLTAADAAANARQSRSTAVQAGKLKPVRLKGKWGFKNAQGRIVVPATFDDVYDFREGLAAVSTAGKWGYVDRTGKAAIKPRFERVGYFAEGLAAAMLNGKYGYIDRTGRMRIQPRFDFAAPFSKGRARVMVKNQAGAIDREGKFVQPLRPLEE
jgi:hypothetical protein